MNFIFEWQKQYFTHSRLSKILFLPLENKIHIFAPPCNILYFFSFLASLYHLEHSLYYVLCKILLLKSRKSNRMRYFLHRVNLHLPRKVSCLYTGLAGSRNNPENCHYLVENIPTVEDINKEYLLLYPVWLFC